MKEIKHPGFVNNKLEIKINLVGFSLFQNGRKVNGNKLKPVILTDDSGRQRSLGFKDYLYDAPALILDGKEEIRLFEPLHPLAYFFMVIIIALGILNRGVVSILIAVFGALLIRNIFLGDRSLVAKAGFSLLVIVAVFALFFSWGMLITILFL